MRLICRLAIIICFALTSRGHADQTPATKPASADDVRISVDTSQAPDLGPWTVQTVVPVLKAWYPKIVAELPVPGYTPPDHFSILFDSKYKGVAKTIGTYIVADPAWMRSELDREAVGAFVHEEVHVVQQPFHVLHGHHMPIWLLEGSCDYIRWFQYEQPKYRPRPKASQAKYDASYRVSAAFLQWVIANYDKDIIPQTNVANYYGVYSDDLWRKYTGKTADQLGAEWKATLELAQTRPVAITEMNGAK